MTEITAIVNFTVPAESESQFLATWQRIAALVATQPGALQRTFYRCVDPQSPFQFVQVAHWESAQALSAALMNGTAEALRQGIDVRADMMRLGVHIARSNYVVERD